MQSLRNFWNILKALAAVIVIGAVSVAIPLLGGILAAIFTAFIIFLLLLEYVSENPEK